MSKGFFAASVLAVSKPPATRIPRCGACGLFKHCNTPKMRPSGKGKRRILLYGEAPGADEDDQGRQFCGRTGQHLEKVLRKFGVDMRGDCIMSNSLICRPKDNRTPTDDEIGYCRPNLTKTLEEFEPEIIIPLGGVACKSLLGMLWKDDVGPVSRWAGWQIPCQKPNAWICPTFHPSYAVRALEGKTSDPVPNLLFEQHLEAALKKEGRPWGTLPDYRSRVKRLFDANEAVPYLEKFMLGKRAVAFDYETNTLKPDSKEARIVCCSVSDGLTTIAFPWHGKARWAMLDLLRSPVPKIGSNIKFEDRWTRAKLRTLVRGWYWDTMLAAHWIDNRPGITSIKFQSFIMLGAESYNDHLEGLLKSVKGSKINQITEIDLGQLLLYCGLDSLLEFEVAMKQMQMMKYPLPT